MKGFLAFSIICLFSICAVTSCQKDTDCKVVIKVRDTLSAPAASADVLLFAPVRSPDGKTTYTADLKAQGQTDGAGEVRFTFKLPAIFDIRASKVVGTKTLTGTGIVKLEEGKTVEKEVQLK